jgi:hypothetical protein
MLLASGVHLVMNRRRFLCDATLATASIAGTRVDSGCLRRAAKGTSAVNGNGKLLHPRQLGKLDAGLAFEGILL